MRDTSALPDSVLLAGIVVAAALAAGAVLARTVRGRAWAMLGAAMILLFTLAYVAFQRQEVRA